MQQKSFNLFCGFFMFIAIVLIAFGVWSIILHFEGDILSLEMGPGIVLILVGLNIISRTHVILVQRFLKEKNKELEELRREVHNFKTKEELRKGNYGAILQ